VGIGRRGSAPSPSLDDASSSDALLGYAMNGEPLPLQHGFPVRLVVTRWYAVTSVEWRIDIEISDAAFTGFYQSEQYFYE
jgi:DMSO/TMAO reductase YedYZ molybdopterin-dependent catalytic subunit